MHGGHQHQPHLLLWMSPQFWSWPRRHARLKGSKSHTAATIEGACLGSFALVQWRSSTTNGLMVASHSFKGTEIAETGTA
eukprot:5855881-Amphidinium_carterae.2